MSDPKTPSWSDDSRFVWDDFVGIEIDDSGAEGEPFDMSVEDDGDDPSGEDDA